VNKKYRVAVMGHTGRGDYGHDIDRVWLRFPERVEIVGVADADPAGRTAAAARLRVDKTYADYRAMLDETRPDIVAVCPRFVDEHQAMVLAAVERGMHVLCEKPLCRTLAEADDIVRACEMTHARLAVAHQTRYSPKLKAVQRLIEEGRIGQLLELRGRGKEDQRGGGEDLWVLGSHIMDMIRAFAGDAQWCAASVTQDGRPIVKGNVALGNEGLGQIAGDAVQAMFGMSSGATAYFASRRDMAGSPSRFGVQVFGSQGVIEILMGALPAVKYLDDPSWSPGRSGRAWQDVSSAGIGQSEPLSDGSLLAGNEWIVRDLLSAIEERREPLVNAREARAAIEMIVACFAAQQAGGRVELPLAERDNPLLRLTD
jgi:predicted dehydrogenase